MRVSNAAARPWPRLVWTDVNHSRNPSCSALGSSVRLPRASSACFAAPCLVDARGIPCTWVGAPTTTRSAPSMCARSACGTVMTVTSKYSPSPVPIASAIARVFPNIDSQTTTACMTVHLLSSREFLTSSTVRHEAARAAGPKVPRCGQLVPV